mmetsp:Transcript_28085/g.82535  ORF Transcript_28085/g.82535 Transcript_28085/m.82535 type:complete len:354 (+) Transcript_28085:1-1062(+)
MMTAMLRVALVAALATHGSCGSLPARGDCAAPRRGSRSKVSLRRRSAPVLAAVDPTTLSTAAAAVDVNAILSKAGKAALGGGASGAAAAVVQVVSLMWVRTTINYQYREGGSMGDAFKKLYAEGGVGRLYQGLPFALVQTPLTRFGDVAANTGVPMIMDAFAVSAGLPAVVRQVAPSVVGAAWRTAWLPIDTIKTSLQVDGEGALDTLRKRVDANGVGTLWEGGLASAATSFAGSYPWWLTYNFLQTLIPAVDPAQDHARLLVLVRLASIGFGAVCVSDTVSNSLRVIKTTKQTSAEPISYPEAVKRVVDKDGLVGLFTRGLGTKLLANGLQGAIFSVTWKYFEQILLGKQMR